MEPQLRVFPHSAPQDTKRFNSALTAVLDPRNRRTYVRPLSVPPTNEPIELLLYAPTTRQSLPSALWGAHRQFMLLGCWSGTHETRVPHNVRLGLTARYR